MTMLIPHTDVDLDAIPIFARVSPALLTLITPGMICTYEDRRVLCQEGEDADHLFVLLHGEVRIEARDSTLVCRRPPAVIGEQAFVEETKRSATVTAVGLVETLRLPRSIVAQLLDDSHFAYNLLLNLSGKLNESTRERAKRYRQERLLIAEFRAHLSEEVMNRLLRTGLEYGKPRDVDAVILMADIRDFSDRSAEMPPDDVAAQLSPYFDSITEIIHAHGGMVDKFIGDAVMAVWGFEGVEPEVMAANAFACAQRMVQVAEAMVFGNCPIKIGVGLNFGRVFMGNVGGDGKRQFTVLGSRVNDTARYESASKKLGMPIILGPDFAVLLQPEVRSTLIVQRVDDLKGVIDKTVYSFNPSESVREGADQ